MKPGTLMKYYDRVAMIIREATWDDIITAHGKGLSKEPIWTYKSGVIKYWIVLGLLLRIGGFLLHKRWNI